ncbi:MAG: hypothetical protein IJA88_02495 [Clostridia bacterium]|nr:hypothetical protein [Clostridia bacterium]
MKTLRNKLLLILSVLLLSCLTLCFSFTFNTVKADAQLNNDIFVMEDGASVAIAKDGLRFRVKMGKNVYDQIVTNDQENTVSLSVLVAPKTVFDALEGEEYIDLAKKVEIEFEDETKIYTKDGYYWANAVLYNLDAENNEAITTSQYDLEFIAVGCIKSNDVVSKYATFENGIENAPRTQYEVLQSAVLDAEDEEGITAGKILDQENSPYKAWFGKDAHPVVVENLDDYTAITGKVENGLTTTAQFKVYNKFEIPADRTYIPTNTTFIHYVKFLNGTSELETVEVVEGENAVYTGETPTNDAKEHDKTNSQLLGYAFENWATENGGSTEANLNGVTGNMNVYASFSKYNLGATLLQEASKADKTVAAFFDQEYGYLDLQNDTSSSSNDKLQNASQRWYSTAVKKSGEDGSAQIQYPAIAKGQTWLKYAIAPYFEYEAGDYVTFDVYADFTGDVVRTYFLLNYANAQNIVEGWNTLVFPADVFVSCKTFYVFFRSDTNWFSNAATAGTATLCFTRAKLLKASEVTNVTDRTVTDWQSAKFEYKIGSMEMVGPVVYQQEGDKANASYFTQSFSNNPSIINGQFHYSHFAKTAAGTLYPTSKPDVLQLVFKNAQTGTLYFTARGFTDGVTYAQMFSKQDPVADNYNGHAGTPKMQYVGDAEDGYKVYSFELGDNQIYRLKLGLDELAFKQVWIKDISTTNPLAE